MEFSEQRPQCRLWAVNTDFKQWGSMTHGMGNETQQRNLLKDSATDQKFKGHLISLSWELLKWPGSLCVCKLEKHFWKVPPIFQIEQISNVLTLQFNNTHKHRILT